MEIITKSLILIIAVQHFCFLVLEMFLWTHPIGLKIFRQSIERATASAALAANQGLYNGFLAAGLIWSLFHPSMEFSQQLKLFFLSCVVLAGAYGAYSVSFTILLVQALPAVIAFLLVVLTR